jgi:hypothetical protein
MKHLLTITAFLVMAAMSTHAQEPGILTCGNMNGHAWQSMAAKEKAIYLAGFSDALTRAAQHLKAHQELSAYWPEKFNIGEVQRGVEKFYGEPANLNIAIPDAVVLMVFQVNGIPTGDIERLLPGLRAKAMAQDCQDPIGGKERLTK